MKRWKFKGQPSIHDQMKIHRRPGTILTSDVVNAYPGTTMRRQNEA